MSIWPLSGASAASLHQALREVHHSSMNVFAGTGGATTLIDKYLRWASDAVRMLRLAMRPEDLNRLVLTPRYWATLATPATSPATIAAITDEVQARQGELAAALADLEAQLAQWGPDPVSGPITYVVPDTNVFLHHEDLLPAIDWHQTLSSTVRSMDNIRIVVPLLVIDELDNAKRDAVRSRARQTLKLIYDQFGQRVDGHRVIQPAQTLAGETSIQLLLDPPQHHRLPRADDELVDRALALQAFVGQKINFVSFDTGAALRARAAGLTVHKLEHTP